MNEHTIEARRACLSDLDDLMCIIHEAQRAIAALGIDQWQDGYPERELIAYDIECERGYVFCVDGAVAGYMMPLTEPEPVYKDIDGAWLSEGKYLTIHRMLIGDKYRGTGLSRYMMRYAEDFARERALLSVRADTHRGNLRMRKLLESFGYTECGLIKYDCDGDPLRVAYELIL